MCAAAGPEKPVSTAGGRVRTDRMEPGHLAGVNRRGAGVRPISTTQRITATARRGAMRQA